MAFFSTFPGNAILTFLVSLVPVVELRGAIPLGVAHDLPLLASMAISVVGNLIPVPFIIIFVRKIFRWLETKSEWLRRVVAYFENKAEGKKDTVLKYEFWGLMVLVAIPLPGTGAWTGSLVAAMLDMQLKRAIPSIFAGVVVAGIIVTLATCGVIAIA